MNRLYCWGVFLAISTTLVQPLKADEPLPYASWLDLEPFSLPAHEMLQAVQELPLPKPEDGTGRPERILLHRQFITFDKDGTCHYEHYDIIQCDSNHKVTSAVTWLPHLGEQPEIRIRVINPDGTQLQSTPDDITIEPAFGDSFKPAWQSSVKTCSVAIGAKVGSICEIHWRMSQRSHLGRCQSISDMGDQYRATGCWMEVVDAPKSLEMRHIIEPAYLTNVVQKPDHSPDRYRMVIVATHVPPTLLHYEPNTPIDVFSVPVSAVGTDILHNDAAQEFRDRIESKVGVPEVWSENVAAIAKYPERSKKIQELVQLVQLLPGAHRHRSSIQDVGETALNGGNGFDRLPLLLGLLRAVGVEAYAALTLETGPVSGRKFQVYQNGLVHIPQTATTPEYWIAPSLPGWTGTDQLDILHGVEVQVLSQPLAPLRTIPVPPPASRIEEEYDITIADNCDCEWKVRQTMHGVEARKLSHFLRATSPEYGLQVIQSRFQFMLPQNDLSMVNPIPVKVQMQDEDLDGNPLVLSATCNVPGQATVESARLNLPFFNSNVNHFPYVAKVRKHPLVVPPLNVSIHCRIHLPAGFSQPKSPEMRHEFGDASLSTTFQMDGGSLLVTRDWNAGDGKFSAEEVNAIREVLLQMISLDFFHMPEVHFVNGHFRQSVEALQDQVRVHPESVELRRYQINLAERLGLFAWERELLTKAITDFPDHVGLQVNYAVDQLPKSFRFDFNQHVDRNRVTDCSCPFCEIGFAINRGDLVHARYEQIGIPT